MENSHLEVEFTELDFQVSFKKISWGLKRGIRV